MFGKKYSDGYADYPGAGRVTDEQVAQFVKEHTHWWDRLDSHFVSDSTILAENMLYGLVDYPKDEKWFFK